MEPLEGFKVAILVDNGFEEVELAEPRRVLDRAGARTAIVSPLDGTVRGWNHLEWGEEFAVDCRLRDVTADEFDALLLPGGVMNPDRLRMHPDAIDFVKGFFAAGKPVAAICHGPWTVVEADAARGRTLTSWPSLKTDIRNAGGTWTDQEVVVDGTLVTSRKPDDLPAFNREMKAVFSQSRQHAG